MPGAGVDDHSGGGVQAQVAQGGEVAGPEAVDELVEPFEDGPGGEAVEGVDAQRAAELAHGRRGLHPAADDVAHDGADPDGGEGDDVVPVAADVDVGDSGEVTGREPEAGCVGQLGGDQAPLQRLGDAVLAAVPQALAEVPYHRRQPNGGA